MYNVDRVRVKLMNLFLIETNVLHVKLLLFTYEPNQMT